MRIVPKLAASAAVALSLSAAVSAQNLSQSFVPQLVIAAPAERPVVLRGVAIRTEISGSLALTSVELTFFNPNARQLEGELQFPLQDGQNVVSMAMDIDGKLREAVPVEKARAQAVFEDVTRAQIDPALAVGHPRQQLQAARVSDSSPARQDGRAALRGNARGAQWQAGLSAAASLRRRSCRSSRSRCA